MSLRVKEICKEKGLSVGELADKLGIKRESLSRAINGKPNLDTLERIALALGVPITDLFEQKDNTAFNCPHCGGNLTVSKRNAILTESIDNT